MDDPMELSNEDSLLKQLNLLMENLEWSAAVELAVEHRQEIARSFTGSWNVGWAHYKLENYDDAVVYFREATSLSPEDPIGFWALGLALVEQGRPHDAEEAFRESIRVRDSFRARQSLAVLYTDLSRLKEAENVHREGLRLQPRHRERVEGLADFLYDIGRRREADELYDRAKSLPTRDERRSKPLAQ